MSAILPELGASFGVSSGVAGSSLTAYLLPFAVLMLVSGTIGDRWGRVRTVRAAYVLYIVAAAAAALAPWFWLFQLTRGLQGVANAFTLPLLMAELTVGIPQERLGRALGFFGAMQAIGQTSAPLVGGLAAELSWRWAFAGIAVVAAVLAVCPMPRGVPAREGPAPRLRDSWRRPVLMPGLIALVGWACLSGMSFLVAFRFEDAFGLSSGLRGLLLTGFGIAGFLTARLVGGASDRFGARVSAAVGLFGGAACLAVIGLSGSLAVTVASWTLAGLWGQLIIVAVNATVLSAAGSGRGGAISTVQAMRFLGMAAAPAAFTAPYHYAAALGFLLPAVLLLLVAPVTVTLNRRPQSNSRSGTGPRARLRHSRG